MNLNTRESGSMGGGLRSDRPEAPLPPLPSRPLVEDTKLLFGAALRPAGATSNRKRDRRERDAEDAPTTVTDEPSSSSLPNGELRELKCHRCLQIGHIARNCTARKEISVARCFKCGQTGHWARSCSKSGSLDAFGPREHEITRIRRDHNNSSNEAQGEGNRGRGQRSTAESLDDQLDAYMRARAAAEKQE